MEELIEQVYNELFRQYDAKLSIEYQGDHFLAFCDSYIIHNVEDSEIMKQVNKITKPYSEVTVKDLMHNPRVLLRAVRVMVLLEISRDFKEFKKNNKKLNVDKTVEQKVQDFDKLLVTIMKFPKSSLKE